MPSGFSLLSAASVVSYPGKTEKLKQKGMTKQSCSYPHDSEEGERNGERGKRWGRGRKTEIGMDSGKIRFL